MRSGAFVCATAVLLAVAFVPVRGFSAASPLSGSCQSTDAERTASIREVSGNSSPQPVVVLEDVSVRALAINPASSGSTNSRVLYLTRSDVPNQIFGISLPSDVPISPATPKTLAHVAGTAVPGSLGDGGPATAAQFDLESDSLTARSGIAVASDGALFLADTLNSTIRRIAGPDDPESGIIRSIAGRWASRPGPELSTPAAVTLDRAGNLYIADTVAGTIYALPKANSEIPGPLHTLVPLRGVAALAVTPNGATLYAASPDSGSVVEIETASGATRQIITAPAGTSPCSSAADETAHAVCPAGLAVDGRNNLFIADAAAGRILRVDALTAVQSRAASGLANPGDIAFDASGDLFVAEQGRKRIVELRALGSPASNLLLSPGSASFPNVAVGSSSPELPFTVTNSSSADLTSLAISIGGTDPTDFSLDNKSCGAALPAASTCTIAISFAPQIAGSRSAILSAVDSNPTDSASAALTGGSSSLTLAPVSETFPDQPTGGSSASQQFVLTNNSTTAAATDLRVALAGANPGDFPVQHSTCIATLPPSSSCALTVSFAPASTGSRTATLLGTDSNPQDSAMAAVSGTGDDYQLQLAQGQGQQVSITAGAAATFNMQVVPDGVFAGTVAISCPAAAATGSTGATTLPVYTTCAVNPPSVTVTPGTPTPFTVAITTSSGAATVQAASIAGSTGSGQTGQIASNVQAIALGILLLLLLMLCIFCAARSIRGQRRRPIWHAALVRTISLLGASVFAMVLLASCHHHSTPPPSTATPPGTYTLTFLSTAQDSQGKSYGVARAITVTLVVN